MNGSETADPESRQGLGDRQSSGYIDLGPAQCSFINEDCARTTKPRTPSNRNEAQGNVWSWSKCGRAISSTSGGVSYQVLSLLLFFGRGALDHKCSDAFSFAATLDAIPIALDQKRLTVQCLFERTRTGSACFLSARGDNVRKIHCQVKRSRIRSPG